MKERPILFSAPMVRALLAGTKTQTRRAMKDSHLWHFIEATGDLGICPYGQPGDRLWVRETWCKVHDAQFGAEDWIDYRATPRYSDVAPAGWHEDRDDPGRLRWKPSIHMPRAASRITLEVTGVRVERLQDISPADCISEGVKFDVRFGGHVVDDDGRHFHAADPRVSYFSLWEAINGEGSVQANPWVWCVSFRNVSERRSEASATAASEVARQDDQCLTQGEVLTE